MPGPLPLGFWGCKKCGSYLTINMSKIKEHTLMYDTITLPSQLCGFEQDDLPDGYKDDEYFFLKIIDISRTRD